MQRMRFRNARGVFIARALLVQLDLRWWGTRTTDADDMSFRLAERRGVGEDFTSSR